MRHLALYISRFGWKYQVCSINAECGVCADRLRQECSEGDGHQETGEPPLSYWAEG